jgi:hypothetical protein
VDDDHFPVENRLTGNIQGAGDLGKSSGPVQPAAGVDLRRSGSLERCPGDGRLDIGPGYFFLVPYGLWFVGAKEIPSSDAFL